MPDIGADAAYRLLLAAELIDAGVAPGELARELGSRVQFGVSKYDENQPPRARRKRARKRPMDIGGAAAGATPRRWLKAGRRANGGIHQEYTLPKDAVAVTRPDGSTIYDPDSTTKKLVAPPRANFQEVYAAGERIADLSLLQQIDPATPSIIRNLFLPPIMPSASIWPGPATP